jgi:beta-galactosidase
METKYSVTRRSFLQSSTALAAAAAFTPSPLFAQSAPASEVEIPDDGWRLWPDTNAPWKDDPLFLPDEVDLARIPVNPPSGGWSALNPQQGIPVILPASVEQFYWDHLSSRPYTEAEYEYAPSDLRFPNGAYRGVSWFWRTFDVPDAWSGKQVTLHIRGYRQRIEIFVNQQLIGYDLIAETSYDCDITSALKPGTNLLALRITNPGGVYDWRDYTQLHWGKYEFHAGRGFGGLDRGISFDVHDTVFLSDLSVLNKPDVTSIDACAELRNNRTQEAQARIRFTIQALDSEETLTSTEVETRIPAQSKAALRSTLSYPGAKLWSVESPALYRVRAELLATSAGTQAHDRKNQIFGFRWFEPKGIGTDAILTLNGNRIRLYSAIEFGYWGFNGLWPTPALAHKSDLAAKSLGLNALQYHRNLGKHEELAQDDRLGLLRYMEPGGGLLAFNSDKDPDANYAPVTKPPIDTSGNGGDATSWSQRYQTFRILRMIRDHRSHPALVVYDLQNEIVPSLRNPRIFRILHQMHEADPSRTIVLHSGIEPYNQAFFLPYDDNIHVEDGTGYSGWSDTHTVGGPGVWQDSLYTDPRNFTQCTGNRREISMQGEMLGWGAPDNHELILKSIREGGGQSYDKADHERILAAYNSFLDKWNFRSAFPTASALFADAGNKLYETWGRILQVIRTDDASDFLVINGWEDQPIDSHSGLVDNQRNSKGDPELIRSALAPLRPVVQPRGVVHKPGDSILLDLFLLNETNQPVSGTLELSITDPSGKTTQLETYPAPAFIPNRFAYPVAEAISSPPLASEGHYTLRLTLNGITTVEGTTRIFVVDPSPATSKIVRAGIVGSANAMADYLPHSKMNVEEFRPQASYDLVILLSQEKEFDSQQFINRLSDLITAVRAGLPLLVLAQSAAGADAAAKTLSKAGAFSYAGLVGESRGCWMGNWVFLKDHPAYAGLPSNQVMKWEYQVAFKDASGLLVDGPAVEVIAGYGRDHDDVLGAATFTARLGRGNLLFQAVRGMQPLLYERFIQNATRFLTGKMY